jgi:hypothetical protein
MSKKYKNKVCVYCAENMATTGDHVFAREFFLLNERDNLPKVPSCAGCNNEKSNLEHYLTAILPFGGRHESAKENLSIMVPGRLAKNRKLQKELQEKEGHSLSVEPGGHATKCMTLPIEGQKLLNLFSAITKGLIWHHWGTLLTKEFSVATIALTRFGEEFFKKNFLSRNSEQRVENTIGSNSFHYVGLQAVDVPQITVWLYSIYDGLKTIETNKNFPESSEFIGTLTGPSELIDSYQKALRAT